MLLVVDANVLFSAIIVKGKTRELIFSDSLQLLVPEFLFTELENHLEELKEKSGLSDEELNMVINLFKERIDVIPKEEFKDDLKKANQICPDPDDTEYFAVAMSKDASLWSDEKKLKGQDELRVISTSELLSLLSE